MAGLRSARLLATVLAALAVPAGAGGQDVGIKRSKLAIPAITGVDAIQLVLAEGWPSSLRLYTTNWGSPIKLKVGASNVTQVEEVGLLDKADRPPRGFEVGFTPLAPPECSAGSSVCVEVSIRPTAPAPGTYRIGLMGDGHLLTLDPPLEVVCNPFERPVTATLSPRVQEAGRTIAGRIHLGCPALPAQVSKSSVGFAGPNNTGQVGATVVRLRQAQSAPNWAQQQLVFPDSLIFAPGHADASFQVKAPRHLTPVQGRNLHERSLALSLEADLRGGTAQYNNVGVGAFASFSYPTLDPTSLSIPKDVVGSAPVVGSVGLTQPSNLAEQVCFSVDNAQGVLAGAAGHRFVVTSAGAPGPDCVSIPAGQTTATFQLTADLSASVTTGESFVLKGIRRHREADGSLPALDTASFPFRAWRSPSLRRVTIGAPPSQPSFIDAFVNGAVQGQVTGYVALTSAAPPGGLSVKLACKPADAVGEELCARYVSVPEGVRIPQGAMEFGFPIQIRASPVEGGVGITAALGSSDASSPLWVDLPPDVTLVDLAATGQPNWRTLTIHVSDVVRAVPARIAVKVSGDGARFVQMPEVVEVPVGENMVNVSIPLTPLPKPIEVTLTAARVGSKVMVSDTIVIQP